MSFEQDQALVQASLQTPNKNIDWVNFVGATVRLKIADEAVAESTSTKLEDEARVAFSQDTVREVLAHPKELVVLHECRKNDNGQTFYAFTAVIPDHDEPFDYYYKAANRTDTESKLQYNLGLFINPAEADRGSYSIVANRQISFNDADSNSTVWMGTGSHQEDRSPDAVFKQPSIVVAVGNLAVANLFTELATQETRFRGKLVGAVLHMGLLALDLGAPLLVIPELEPEIKKQTYVMESRKQLSKKLIAINAECISALLSAGGQFGLDRAKLMDEAVEPFAGAKASFLPFVGDSRTWPYIDVDDFNMEIKKIAEIQSSLSKEKEEHKRRLKLYGEFEQILTAMKG